jgi:hypothetical protein
MSEFDCQLVVEFIPLFLELAGGTARLTEYLLQFIDGLLQSLPILHPPLLRLPRKSRELRLQLIILLTELLNLRGILLALPLPAHELVNRKLDLLLWFGLFVRGRFYGFFVEGRLTCEILRGFLTRLHI